MTKTTKFVLDLIDRILVKNNDTSREVWDVLTALRGPDSDDNRVKMTNTVPIRTAAFPRTAAKYQELYAQGKHYDTLAIMAVRPEYRGMDGGKDQHWHYNLHITKARRVLADKL